jgi:hypothetical protein
MAYNYGYKSDGTILDGFLNWIQKHHYDWYRNNISKISDLNPHFIEIRKQCEPNKPVAKETEKNAIYISKSLGFKKLQEYFNTI